MKRDNVFRRVVAAAVVATVLAWMVVPSAQAEPVKGSKRRSAGFDLMRAGATWNANINRVQCGLDNQGNICTDVTGSPLGGGGFWPTGSPNQYIFNSGLQIAGIVPQSAAIWAGDTVGAFIFNASTTGDGQQVTLIYSSADPADVADWPNGAVVRDADIFNSALLGRSFVSQEDTWVRYYDGPGLLSGRTHPMGVLVEQRGLAWNYPSGNEDIMYFVFTFYNITASDPAAYSGLDPAIQSEIAAIAAGWVSDVESRLGVDLPAGGIRFDSVYAAFGMDPDVGDAGSNSSTAILPFQMGLAYKNDFDEPTWLFPPDINGPPFGPYPGFIGVKYLKSPLDPATGQPVGLTLFSNTTNPSAANSLFPDPDGVSQLWRYLSGGIEPAEGDTPCQINPPRVRRLCALVQAPTDTRFFQSSGPFSLNAGESGTIVVAYVHAAPVAAEVAPFFGGNLAPGIPPSGAEILNDPTTLRTIERAAGWLGQNDDDNNGEIDQDEVVTLERSLLRKSLVAQSLFDGKFLLPFAPESPEFFLVPGNRQVTVVWQPSASENLGDPYFEIAADVTSPLYDPNYREFDVEGYRVYRGRTRAQLELLAQFDYAGTTFVDYTGGWAYLGRCAPELGISDDCPSTDFLTDPVSHELVGTIPQVPPGGRVELADGSILITSQVNAVEEAGFPALTNSGVPFAFVDNAVLNSVTYFYAVTAFDLNSVASIIQGSLESPLTAKAVVPRAPAANAVAAVLVSKVTGDDGVALDATAPWPAIDPNDGTFNGNIPPISTGLLELTAAVVEALPPGDITVRIDSVGVGWAGGFGPSASIYVTMMAGGQNFAAVITDLTQPRFNSSATSSYVIAEAIIPYDSVAARRYGISFTEDVRMPVRFSGTTVPMAFTSPAVATAVGRYGASGFSEATRFLSHSRWFDEGGAEPPDPTITASADAAQHAGDLSGVDRIWAPSGYRQPSGEVAVVLRGQGASASTAWYPADFVIEWNADGSVTASDVTHNTTLPPAGSGGSGVGFITLTNILATGVDQAQWDAEVADGVGSPAYNILNYNHLYMTQPTCSNTWWAIPDLCIDMSNTAELVPLDFDTDGTADGNGIVMWVNGEIFFMEMTALPAAGTQWHLRAVSGHIEADCTPAVGPVATDCSSYTFAPNTAGATVVPGLRFTVTVETVAGIDATTAGDLSNVHTLPDPYYVTSGLEITPQQKVLKFVNLPSQAIIRVYSTSGVLVTLVEHNDPLGGGEATWNLRNRNSQFVASGVYFYHVETPTGEERIGRFTVINSGNLAIGQQAQ
jgi:hypothetical protein